MHRDQGQELNTVDSEQMLLTEKQQQPSAKCPQRPVGVHQCRSRFSTEDAIGGGHTHHPKGWAENQVAGKTALEPNWQSVHGHESWISELMKKTKRRRDAPNASEDRLSDS